MLHYNVFSRAITAPVNQLRGMPTVCYFDDFASPTHLVLGEKARSVFSRFCALMALQLRPGKSAAGNKIIVLGMLGCFPCAKNQFRPVISLTPEKRDKWTSLITSYMKGGQMPHRCLDKIIGGLSFSQTSLFGEFARTQLRPLYAALYRRVYHARLPILERNSLSWRIRAIPEFTPRQAIPRPCRADWLMYTDASTDPSTRRAPCFAETLTHPAWTPVSPIARR